jgi:hypothetical protein
MAAGSKNNPENKGRQAAPAFDTVLVCSPTKGGLGMRKAFVKRPKAGK